MSDIVLQLVWVAAHHGLRKGGAYLWSHRRECNETRCATCEELVRHLALWNRVYDITTALGFPPAPGPHEASR